MYTTDAKAWLRHAGYRIEHQKRRLLVQTDSGIVILKIAWANRVSTHTVDKLLKDKNIDRRKRT